MMWQITVDSNAKGNDPVLKHDRLLNVNAGKAVRKTTQTQQNKHK